MRWGMNTFMETFQHEVGNEHIYGNFSTRGGECTHLGNFSHKLSSWYLCVMCSLIHNGMRSYCNVQIQDCCLYFLSHPCLYMVACTSSIPWQVLEKLLHVLSNELSGWTVCECSHCIDYTQDCAGFLSSSCPHMVLVVTLKQVREKGFMCSSWVSAVVKMNVHTALIKIGIFVESMVVFLYCCPDCPSCRTNAIQMGWATWAIWVTIKKFRLCQYMVIVLPCNTCMERKWDEKNTSVNVPQWILQLGRIRCVCSSCSA